MKRMLVLFLCVLFLAFPANAYALSIPSQAIAPWEVFSKVDALNFSSRVGITTVWGDYWERSEEPYGVLNSSQSQELGNAHSGNYAVYSNLDLGNGINRIIARVSLPSGNNTLEIRTGNINGQVIATCPISATGQAVYKTIPCLLSVPVSGVQTLVFKFDGANNGLRFNWFGFWAKGTTQEIDKLQKISNPNQSNKSSPVIPVSGTPVRTQAMLPGSNEVLATSYGLWSPQKEGECPKWMHDTYWVKAEDNKIYPTWHPPVDFNSETNTYCTYGHEHGDDPRSSEVFNVAGMPAFGYIVEQQASGHRHEDHVGHKVLVANNWRMYNAKNTSETKSCDATIKLHMGTHSPDALTNTAHEMFVSGQCEGLEPFNVKHFALFGKAGTFKEPETPLCALGVTSGITPNPIDQPMGGMHRGIATKDCYLRGTEQEKLNLANNRTGEFWLTGFAGGSFYFNVKNPSRYFNQDSPTKIGRMNELCLDQDHPLSKTLLCQESVASGATWDSVRSPFRGTVHSNTHLAALAFNGSPSSTVYTDAYGRNQRLSPSPVEGIIYKQTVPIQAFHYKVDGQASAFPNTDYSVFGKNGVRSPN